MNIALIAHDNKKADMVAFVSKRLPFFNREDVTIITTGTTGKHCKHAADELGISERTLYRKIKQFDIDL